MIRTSLIFLAGLTTAGSSVFAQQAGIVSGKLLPKKEAASVVYAPLRLTELTLLEALPHGSEVKKGEPVAIGKLKNVDNLIESTERAIKSQELALERLKFDLEQLKYSSDNQINWAKTTVDRSGQNLKDFLDKQKARMIAEEDEKLSKMDRLINYKEAEIKQLSKMYNDDQVAEETEEIILTRIKNDLNDLLFSKAGAVLAADLGKARRIVRAEEDFQIALESSKLKLNETEGKALFDLQQKQLELVAAEAALEESKARLDELKADRAMCEFKAPVDGIVLYGGYNGDKWDSATAASKLKPGGKLVAYEKIATIIPRSADMVVVASFPSAMNASKAGDPVTLTVRAGEQIIPLGESGTGTISEVDSIPGIDGQLRCIITPKEKIFAPGITVQVNFDK